MLTNKQINALRIMISLDELDVRTAHDLSEATGISISYIEQIIRYLRSAGLIESLHGPGGGYMAARSLARISVADTLACLSSNKAPQLVVNALNGVTLRDLKNAG